MFNVNSSNDLVKENDVHTVNFHGDQIVSIEKNGKKFVSMKPIVENMGLVWSGQYEKLKKDERFIHSDIYMVDASGSKRRMLCLPVDQLAGWLFTINPNKVSIDIREKVIRYQKECVQVLNDYWTKGYAVKQYAGMTASQALKLAYQHAEKAEEAERKLLESKEREMALEPRAAFTDKFLSNTKDVIGLGDVAKLSGIKQLGQNCLIGAMKDAGILIKRYGGTKVCQTWIDRDFAVMEWFPFYHSDGRLDQSPKTLLTRKGAYHLLINCLGNFDFRGYRKMHKIIDDEGHILPEYMPKDRNIDETMKLIGGNHAN